MTDIDIDVQAAWDCWNDGLHCEDMGAPSPVFAHGFRMGAKDPGISAQYAWRAYPGVSSCEPVPPALVEGLNRGAAFKGDRNEKPADPGG